MARIRSGMRYIRVQMWDNRKQVLLAGGGSVTLHVLFLLLWAFAVHWLPKPKTPPPPAPPIHLQLVQATPPPPLVVPEATPTPHMVPFIDTSSRVPSARPSATPAFQSNQDTEAASHLAATGRQAVAHLERQGSTRLCL